MRIMEVGINVHLNHNVPATNSAFFLSIDMRYWLLHETNTAGTDMQLKFCSLHLL